LANALSISGFHRGSREGLLTALIAFLVHGASPSSTWGDSIKTLDGQTYSGVARLTNNALVITDTNASEFTIGISNLQSAVFSDDVNVIPGERTLFGPWANQDIGSVGKPGGARQASNSVFAVRASGTGITPKIDGFHFVYVQMGGDAEIVARISNLESKSAAAQAGLMIRQTLGPESPQAAVLLTPDHETEFQSRASRKKPNSEMRRSKSPRAQWLKLTKRGKFFTGFVSEDGRDWKVVGSQTISLSPTRNPDDQWFIGLAVSSHANSAVCAGRFEEVSVHLQGLKADLFVDEFKTPAKTLILPNLPKTASSFEEYHPTTIRWTGQILAQHQDRYSFEIRSRDKANLWINDRLAYSSGQSSHFSIPLERGQAANMKLETHLTQPNKLSAILWCSTAAHGQAPVADNMLLPYAPVEVPSSSTNQHQSELDLGRFQGAAPGIVLKNGTFLAGNVKEVNDPVLKFEPSRGSAITVGTINVARIQFCSLSPQLAARITNGTPGLLLRNGDFIEGELKGFSQGRATISSIIFGLRSYDTSRQAAAVVLRVFKPAGRFAVRTNGGSAFFADSLELQNDKAIIPEEFLGKWTLGLSDLIDIRRLPDSGAN